MGTSGRRASVAADVVVLGAGIIGVAIARSLARAGLDVLAVEAESAAGLGSSGRCDGNVLVSTKEDPAVRSMTRRSIDMYRHWQAELGRDIRFEQRGSIVFATSEAQLGHAAERTSRLQGDGIQVRVINSSELHDREPHLAPGPLGGTFCDDDAEVYPPAVVAALFSDAREHGCRFLFGERALSLLLTDDGRVAGVRTSRGVISAPVVVNALGAWAAALELPAHAAPVPVEPRQGVLIATDHRPGIIRHNIREATYISDRANRTDDYQGHVSFAAEPTYAGNILVGSSRRFTGFDLTPTHTMVGEIMQRAISYYPLLARAQLVRVFAGLRPWTPDNRPLIGESRRIPGWVLATGHEGEGIGTAPATAELITTLVTGVEPDERQRRALAAFDPDRFLPAGAAP